MQAEIILAGGTFGAVEEGGEFDELVPGVEKIEVQDLLPCHTFVDGIYGGMVAGQWQIKTARRRQTVAIAGRQPNP